MLNKLTPYLCLALVAVVVILVILLLTDSKPVDSHKAEYEQLQNQYGIVVAQNEAAAQTKEVLYAELGRRESIEQALNAQLAIYRYDLDKSTSKAVNLAQDIKRLKSDTTEKDTKCDDLADEVLQYAQLYEHYKGLADSLQDNTDSFKLAYQGANVKIQSLYDNLYASYTRLHDAYVSLISDQATLNKSLRRQKLKTKIAAILGILGTGAALIK